MSIVCEAEAIHDCVEPFEPSDEGDGAWRAFPGVTVPAAEPGDRPGGPGETELGMRVLLLGGLAFELADQRLQHGDLGRTEQARGWQVVAGFTPPVHELHGIHGGDQQPCITEECYEHQNRYYAKR